MCFTRRDILRVAGSLAAGLAAIKLLPACGSDGEDQPPQGGAELPSLGGAPDSDEGRTIAAFCDTVVPGKHRDPMGAPGAIDVGAPALFFDPELPAGPYLGILVLTLDAFAKLEGGTGFANIDVATRERALARAIQEIAILEFAVQLAKLATFAAPAMGTYLGYPGANAGYINDPDFSFKRAMSREITGDGNLP